MFTEPTSPNGPRFYDLADGQIKALHLWHDGEWWVFRELRDEWVSERKLSIDDAVRIVIAAEKKHRPGEIDDLRESVAGARQAAKDHAARIRVLDRALAESVKLQSHYAELLNQYDGGRRLTFASGQDWIARLAAADERVELYRRLSDPRTGEEFEPRMEHE